MRKVALIGSGSWGTAVAGLAARQAEAVFLWCRDEAVAKHINHHHVNPRHLSSYQLPNNVFATHELAFALKEAEAVLIAVPSPHMRSICKRMQGLISSDCPVLVFTKGIEPETLQFMVEVAASELKNPERFAVLSGPNHAEEVSQDVVSAAVIAATNHTLAQTLATLLANPHFRPYTGLDLIGTQVCGTAKNVIALASGVSVGLQMGDNTRAVLMTRGLAEIARLAKALGANHITAMGLAGMGDLVVTCTSHFSRNRSFGEALVTGAQLQDFEHTHNCIVEGAHAAPAILALANKHNVEMPITQAVCDLLSCKKSPLEAMYALLERELRSEFYGISERNADA